MNCENDNCYIFLHKVLISSKGFLEVGRSKTLEDFREYDFLNVLQFD